jgi:hypothetical protein
MLVHFSLFLLLHLSPPTSFNTKQLRASYHEAIYQEDKAKALLTDLKNIPSPSAIQKAYLGSTQMLMAKFTYLPNQKFSWFNTGKKNLEEAIAADPKQAEIIYLRYSIQLNVPSFLGYSQNKAADRAFLLQEIRKIQDKDLQERIKLFLLKEASLTQQERALLP